jgi:xylan 1,4-beta-xylosidase
VLLVFASGEYGQQPYPRKSLVAFERLFNVAGGADDTVDISVTLGGLARFDQQGNEVLYPGRYSMLIDVPTQTTWDFELTGEAVVLDEWPQQ